jgi:hypothetical protein
MSSHHFVKEGQEPALFILEPFSFDHAAPLLEWSPLVIVADHVLEAVLQWGIKIDVVLQQKFPLGELQELVADQRPVHVISGGSGPLLEKGLEFLIDGNYGAVNILVNVNELFFDEAVKFSGQLQLVAFTGEEKYSLISSGKFEKWLEKGADLKVFQNAEGTFQYTGLAKIGENWTVEDTKLVSIESKAPFWVGELL